MALSSPTQTSTDRTSTTSGPVGTSTVAVFYVGGPLGGQQHVHTVGGEAGELPATRTAHGGQYALQRQDGHTDVYAWTPDADRADKTPADGDEASQLLEDNGGSTPVLDQDVTSSMTIASAEAPAASIAERQTKGPKPAAVEADKAAASKAGVDDSTSPRTATDTKGVSKPAGTAGKG